MKNTLACTILIIAFAVLTPTPASAQAKKNSEPELITQEPFAISAKDEAAGIEGTIRVMAAIDKTGKVTRTLTYVGPMWPCGESLGKRVQDINNDAEKAVMKYKFSPATEDGVPVTTNVAVAIPVGASARKTAGLSDGSPKPRMVSGGVINGKAISLPKPEYPREARSSGAQGTVIVQVLIGEDGKVLKAQAIEGPLLLHNASRDAACGAKFSPTLLKGEPVKVSGDITYIFVP